MPGRGKVGRGGAGHGHRVAVASVTIALLAAGAVRGAQSSAPVSPVAAETPAVAPAVAMAGGGEAARQREEKLIAALLLRIAERVTWPEGAFPEADTPLSICAVGADPLGLALDDLDTRETAGRRAAVRRFPSPRELEYCHVLFIAASERPRLSQILEVASRAPVLTAGRTDDFAESGGVVELRAKALRPGFEINAAAAESAGLELDESLLELADAVHR